MAFDAPGLEKTRSEQCLGLQQICQASSSVSAPEIRHFRISFKCLSTTLGRFRAWSQGAKLSEPGHCENHRAPSNQMDGPLSFILVSITLKRCSFFQQFSIVLWQNVALPNPMASRPLREALPSLRPAPSRHAPRPCLGGAIMLIWQAASNLTRDRLKQMGARE